METSSCFWIGLEQPTNCSIEQLQIMYVSYDCFLTNKQTSACVWIGLSNQQFARFDRLQNMLVSLLCTTISHDCFAQNYAKCQKIVHQGSTKIRIQPQTFISRIYVGEMRPLFIFVPLVLETLKEYSADFKNRLRTSKVVSRLGNSLEKVQLAQESQQKPIF